MVNSAALTNDDVAGNCSLATKNFYTESFTLRIAAVLYTAFAFFVSHWELF
jgi:hypothetical protein